MSFTHNQTCKASMQLMRSGMQLDGDREINSWTLLGVIGILLLTDYIKVGNSSNRRNINCEDKWSQDGILWNASGSQLESIQKTAIRIIYQVTRHMPYDSLLYYSNITSLQDRWS